MAKNSDKADIKMDQDSLKQGLKDTESRKSGYYHEVGSNGLYKHNIHKKANMTLRETNTLRDSMQNLPDTTRDNDMFDNIHNHHNSAVEQASSNTNSFSIKRRPKLQNIMSNNGKSDNQASDGRLVISDCGLSNLGLSIDATSKRFRCMDQDDVVSYKDADGQRDSQKLPETKHQLPSIVQSFNQTPAMHQLSSTTKTTQKKKAPLDEKQLHQLRLSKNGSS